MSTQPGWLVLGDLFEEKLVFNMASEVKTLKTKSGRVSKQRINVINDILNNVDDEEFCYEYSIGTKVY